MTDSQTPGAAAPDDDAAPAPKWEERDAWTALDDLDASPVHVPASEWPAGAEGLDRPGLFALAVDGAGAADLARGLGRGRWMRSVGVMCSRIAIPPRGRRPCCAAPVRARRLGPL